MVLVILLCNSHQHKGMRTIDVGIAQLSMHSIREVCGTEDVGLAVGLFKAFFEGFKDVESGVKGI